VTNSSFSWLRWRRQLLIGRMRWWLIEYDAWSKSPIGTLEITPLDLDFPFWLKLNLKQLSDEHIHWFRLAENEIHHDAEAQVLRLFHVGVCHVRISSSTKHWFLYFGSYKMKFLYSKIRGIFGIFGGSWSNMRGLNNNFHIIFLMGIKPNKQPNKINNINTIYY
jgi:hypothetical protein